MSTAESKTHRVDPHDDATHDPALYAPAQVVEPLASLEAIDEAVVEQYHELGFIAVNNALTAGEVESARAGLADLIDGRNAGFNGVQLESWAKGDDGGAKATERGQLVRKLMAFCRHEPRLAAASEHAGLLAVVRRLMGGRAPKMFQDMALLKPPRGREKPWHQDHAYFDLALGEPVVGVWIALDEATPANGCMHLIPGSHRDGPTVHFQRRDWQICDTTVRGRHVVACPLKPGGLLLFNGLTWHGTPTNQTEQRRRALQFHYAPADAVWTDKQARLDVFGEEGKDVEC